MRHEKHTAWGYIVPPVVRTNGECKVIRDMEEPGGELKVSIYESFENAEWLIGLTVDYCCCQNEVVATDLISQSCDRPQIRVKDLPARELVSGEEKSKGKPMNIAPFLSDDRLSIDCRAGIG